jgi:hypothetical protein
LGDRKAQIIPMIWPMQRGTLGKCPVYPSTALDLRASELGFAALQSVRAKKAQPPSITDGG